MTTRRLLLKAGAAAGVASVAGMAWSQPAAGKTVRMIVPFPAGGVTDVVARMLTQGLGELMGRPVIVDNLGGAGGDIGASAAARAQGDGNTFLFAGSSLIINSVLKSKVPYALMQSLVPVSLVAELPFAIVVNASLPVRTLPELIAYAKAHPGKLNFGSGGNGTAPHISGELLKIRTGTQMVHVPYKGGAAALNDLLGGQIQLMVDSAPPFLPHIQSGALRAIAVPSQKRLASLPHVPTSGEAGVAGIETASSLTLWAPGGTSAEVIRQVSRDIAAVLARPEVRAALAKAGVEPVGSSPEQLQKYAQSELEKWSEVVQRSGAKID